MKFIAMALLLAVTATASKAFAMMVTVLPDSWPAASKVLSRCTKAVVSVTRASSVAYAALMSPLLIPVSMTDIM